MFVIYLHTKFHNLAPVVPYHHWTKANDSFWMVAMLLVYIQYHISVTEAAYFSQLYNHT
jgi:hypothetical protein